VTDIIINCESLLSKRNNKRKRRVGWIIKVVTVDVIVRCYKEENFDGPITVAEAAAHPSPFEKQNRINSTYNKSKETKVGSSYYYYQEQEHT